MLGTPISTDMVLVRASNYIFFHMKKKLVYTGSTLLVIAPQTNIIIEIFLNETNTNIGMEPIERKINFFQYFNKI